MKATKTPTSELCKDALEHYLKLSDEASHYNSLIPHAIEVYQRVKEKLDFNLDMEKQGWLYNWGGNEVVWLLEYLWDGGRFNNLKKHEWIVVLAEERDAALEKLRKIEELIESWEPREPSDDYRLQPYWDQLLEIIVQKEESQ